MKKEKVIMNSASKYWRRKSCRMHVCIIHYSLLIVTCILLAACHKQRDRNGILTERAMAEVMYDYQLAVALAAEEGGSDAAEREFRYTQAALRRHNVTEAEYRISVAHYARDPKAMLALTQRVGERFTREVEQAQAESFADESSNGVSSRDTIVVWERREGTLLSAVTDNQFTLSIPGRNIPKCDCLVFGYRAAWLSRSESQNAGIILTVTYEGDSIVRRQEGVRDIRYTQGVRLDLSPTRRVKRVDVHVCQSAPWSTTPQLLSLTDLSLWCLSKNR